RCGQLALQDPGNHKGAPVRTSLSIGVQLHDTFLLRENGPRLSLRERRSMAARRVRSWAHSDASQQRSTSVAFRAKRTLTEPRLQKADLRAHAFLTSARHAAFCCDARP